MKQKSELEREVARAMKTVRSAVRLKHSDAADEELNTLLPEIEAAILTAASEGKSYKLDLAGIFE